ASAHLDGRTGAGADQLRPPDVAGIFRAADDRRELCPCQEQQMVAAGRNRISGVELAGRQPGWNAGASPPAAAAEVRILRRPYSRQLRFGCAYGWAGSLGIYEPGDRHGVAGAFSTALDSVVSGDVHDGRVPNVILEFRAHGVACAAGGG